MKTRPITKAFLLALALFCASELVVRVFFARNMSGRFEYGYNSTSGFEEKSDGTVRLVRAGGRRFHPQSFTRQRPDGVFRVMVIGDSVPRGGSLASSYAVQVGEQLNKLGVKAESFNLAVAGYGARRNQVVLQQALKYQPSLVILHVNNSNEYEDEREWRRAQEFQSWHPKNWLMKSLVLRRVHEMKTEKVFWEWLPPEIRNQRAVNDADAEVLASMDKNKIREWDELVRRKTAENIELARKAGAKVVLVTQARLERPPGGGAELNDYGLDELVEPLLGADVLRVSMKKVFASPGAAAVFADSAHLRPEGHKLLAAAIVEALRGQSKQ
ncbi:MAG: SGNH/GDSL hydrolase family protein [Verrucomicrobia bacterium]|nr:SGNH/GDSL hydrolase family protein [Verrucomicrobiota bacterium]